MTKGIVFLAATVVLAGSAGRAQAQECTVTRDQVLADLKAGVTIDEIEKKYAGCTTVDPTNLTSQEPDKAQPITALAAGAPSEMITNTGSTFWEAIKSCGYHPQREEADCTVEIRQRFGFNGPICQAPGSHEFLLFCADLGGGLVPINTNGFHIHDERFGVGPNWSFASSIQSNARLLAVSNSGQTLRGRVILSWQLPPTGCGYKPHWGNQSDFRFRLDP